MNTMNAAIFEALNNLAGQSLLLDTFVVFVTEYLGWLAVAGVFLLPFLSGRQRARRAWYAVAFCLLAALLARLGPVELIRAFFPAARPFEVVSSVFQLVDHSPARALPSGHAAFFFALAAAVFFFWDKKAGLIYFVIAFLISVSRVIAGIHWPLDIAAGALVGMGTAFVLQRIVRKLAPAAFFEKGE